jgi:DivIVA domain-containing protein
MDEMEQPIEATGRSPLAEIAHKEFTVVLRGYDRDEVDQFLAQVEEALQDLVERADDRPAPGHVAEWMGNEVAAVLAAAEAAAAKVTSDAEAASEAVRLQAEIDVVEARKGVERARADAAKLRDTAEEDAAEIKLKAQEEAERILREARLVAQRVENAAESRREEILADARRGVRDLQEREEEIHARIAALEETFGALRGVVSDQAGIVSSQPIREEDRPTEERRVVDLSDAESKEREKSS